MSISLLGGGPLHDVTARLRLAGHGGHRVLSRILAALLITWVPLLALSAARGAAVGDAVVVPFLHDLTAQVRFLVSVPVLVAAGAFVEPRLREAVHALERGGVIADADRPAFARTLRLASRLLRSRFELLLLVLVGVAALTERVTLLSAVSSWERVGTTRWASLTPAGTWLVVVSLPVLRFLILRWLFRCGVWAWVMIRVARLPLRLTATDPDGACGLAPLGVAQASLVAPLVLALGANYAGFVGNRALYLGVPVQDSLTGVALFAACALALSLLPLLVFTRRLAAARRRGLLDYGVLSTRLARDFHTAWVAPGAPPARELLTRGDVSTLCDQQHVFEAVTRSRTLPIDRQAARLLLMATAAPFVPLVVSQVPPEQALQVLKALAL